MREHLILLPGWGFGPAVLQPLCEALSQQADWLLVEVEPLPDLLEADAWLEALEQRLPDQAWLAGWSLGGMLAAHVAARRGERCRGLISLAGNACFRARDDWPTAMPAEAFDTFCQAFALGPEETLRRFSLLCSRGAYDPRTLARQLQINQADLAVPVLAAGLELLARLDNRQALQRYAGPQLHLFAEHDALVPLTASEALSGLLPRATVAVMPGASHGLPLERPDDVAQTLVAFLETVRRG